MRWLNRRSLVTVLIVSIIALFLAAACAGPAGTTGPQGEKGATGAQGAPGAKGDTGAKGDKGAQGDKGDKGAAGAAGPAGPTVPLSLMVVPTAATGASASALPAVIVVGKDQPKFTVYASGFPAGDFVTVELKIDDKTSYIMRIIAAGSDRTVRESGTYLAKFQAPAGITPDIPAGLYQVILTAGPSGLSASAPVLMVTTK